MEFEIGCCIEAVIGCLYGGCDWLPGQFSVSVKQCFTACMEASQAGKQGELACSLDCLFCSLQCAVCSVQCVVSSVQCPVCSIQCVVSSVQCALISMHCAVRSAQCEVGSGQWEKWCGMKCIKYIDNVNSLHRPRVADLLSPE